MRSWLSSNVYTACPYRLETPSQGCLSVLKQQQENPAATELFVHPPLLHSIHALPHKTMAMPASPALPVELWLDIFRWATVSHSTPSLCATEYTPFQAEITDAIDKEAVAVKRALVRVCKQWRRLATNLLLEDVVIREDGSMLKRALLAEGEEEKRCSSVRRACLPYSSCIPCNKDLTEAASVLKSCSQLEVLVRPIPSRMDDLRFELPAEECPPLGSLKRLDWWHHNDAARSGGVNALTDVLRAAPNLQYVSLGGDLWLSSLQRTPIALPALTTLRIRRMNVLFLQQICRWSLPSLTNVVIDTHSNQSLLEGFWSTFGDQIRTVELGKSLRFYLCDMVYYALANCANLEELSYYVQFTSPPHLLAEEHRALATVRLHAAENAFFTDKLDGGDELWEHLDGHFSLFARPVFPALKRVVLHGNWDAVQHDARFASLAQKLLDRGCALEFEPGF